MSVHSYGRSLTNKELRKEKESSKECELAACGKKRIVVEATRNGL